LRLSEGGEDLAVSDDPSLLQRSDELAVREAFLLESGVDLYVPDASDVALLVSSVRERVCASMKEAFHSLSLLVVAAKAPSLRVAEDVLSALEGICSFLYSCHGIILNLLLCELSFAMKLNCREETALFLGCHLEGDGALLVELRSSALLRVEVVLTRVTSNKLTVLGNLDSL
jgi:hypothetical protein